MCLLLCSRSFQSINLIPHSSLIAVLPMIDYSNGRVLKLIVRRRKYRFCAKRSTHQNKQTTRLINRRTGASGRVYNIAKIERHHRGLVMNNNRVAIAQFISGVKGGWSCPLDSACGLHGGQKMGAFYLPTHEEQKKCLCLCFVLSAKLEDRSLNVRQQFCS